MTDVPDDFVGRQVKQLPLGPTPGVFNEPQADKVGVNGHDPLCCSGLQLLARAGLDADDPDVLLEAHVRRQKLARLGDPEASVQADQRDEINRRVVLLGVPPVAGAEDAPELRLGEGVL